MMLELVVLPLLCLVSVVKPVACASGLLKLLSENVCECLHAVEAGIIGQGVVWAA